MSIDAKKALVLRFVEVWGRGSLDLVDELAASDITVAYPLLPDELHSAEAFKQRLAQIHAAIPDLEVTTNELVAEGDKVVLRWTLEGTHRGTFAGIPATGKRVHLTGITIYRVVEGKVVEERGEEDALGLWRQLGALPAPTSTA